MGATSSINQKKCKTLFDYATILMQDIEIILPQESKQLQNKTDNLLTRKLKIINVEIIEMLSKAKAPLISVKTEDIQQENLSSFFQKYLLEKYYEHEHDPVDQLPSSELIRQIRLMQFDKILKLPKAECVKPIVKFILGLKEYCLMVNQLLLRLNTIDLGLSLTFYVTFWEQLTFHLPYLRDIYSLALVNKLFDSEQYQLNPHLRIEEIVAKIWGTTVKDVYWNLFIKEFEKMRNTNQQSALPIAAYFRLLLDMNINQMSLNWIGHIEKMKTYSNGLQFLLSQFNPKMFYLEKMKEFSDSYEQLLEFWKKDEQILKQILPTWIVDAHFSTALFELIDTEIHSTIKQMPSEEQEKLRILSFWHQAETKKLQQQLQDPEYALGMDFEDFVQIGGFGFQSRKGTVQQVIDIMQTKHEFQSDILPSVSTQGSGMKYTSNITKGSNLEKIEEEVENEMNEQEVIQKKEEFIQSQVLERNQEQQQDQQQNNISQANKIMEFCDLYDKSKWKVLDAIENRNNQIEFRNSQYGYSVNVIDSQIFNFTYTVSEEDAVNFLQTLNKIKYFNSNHQKSFQIPVGQQPTLAEQLLS